jgi:hypothetical protein
VSVGLLIPRCLAFWSLLMVWSLCFSEVAARKEAVMQLERMQRSTEQVIVFFFVLLRHRWSSFTPAIWRVPWRELLSGVLPCHNAAMPNALFALLGCVLHS